MSSDVVPKVKLKYIHSITSDAHSSDLMSRYKRPTRGLYDTGADDNTTDDPFIIHNLRRLDANERVTLYDAGSHKHTNDFGGEGILRDQNGKDKIIFLKYTPSLKVTAIDPSKLRTPKLPCIEETMVSDHLRSQYYHRNRYKNGITEIVPLSRVNRNDSGIDRYYTLPFLKIPSTKIQEYVDLLGLHVDTSCQIQARSRLNKETTNLLWHFRLCHIHEGAIIATAKQTNGIRDFRPRTSIEKCGQSWV